VLPARGRPWSRAFPAPTGAVAWFRSFAQRMTSAGSSKPGTNRQERALIWALRPTKGFSSEISRPSGNGTLQKRLACEKARAQIGQIALRGQAAGARKRPLSRHPDGLQPPWNQTRRHHRDMLRASVEARTAKSFASRSDIPHSAVFGDPWAF